MGHIRTILDKNLDPDARSWYAVAAVGYGWSRNVLMNTIMNQSRERTGAALSNFSRQLGASDSELAQQVAKDPYASEFLGSTGEVAERDLEQALMDRIVDTLRELGPRVAFVGRQVHFEVGGDDFYVAQVDDKLRREAHDDTVGMLICGSKNDYTVRYALGRSDSPMAVSTCTYENLPAAEQRALPPADELTAAFDQIGSTGDVNGSPST